MVRHQKYLGSYHAVQTTDFWGSKEGRNAQSFFNTVFLFIGVFSSLCPVDLVFSQLVVSTFKMLNLLRIYQWPETTLKPSQLGQPHKNLIIGAQHANERKRKAGFFTPSFSQNCYNLMHNHHLKHDINNPMSTIHHSLNCSCLKCWITTCPSPSVSSPNTDIAKVATSTPILFPS